MENNKTPSIRFKGFTDPWEQRKLKETIEYIVDNRGKNPDYYCSEGIPVIDNFMIRNSLYPDLNTATRFIDENLYQNFIRKYNEEDDILLTLVGNGIGNITLFPKDKAVIIQNTLGFRAKVDKKFLFFLLMANNEALVKLDRGMAQPSIRQDEILDFDIYVPSNSEQTQIGEYFSNLDNLITLHQRKYNKLLNVKKSMLEKMFPKNGSNIPEIRFKGFTDPWEQRKFEDVTFLSGEKNKNNLPFESYSVTNENGFVPQNEQFENGGTMATADKRMYYIVSKNSFAYNPARINVGSIGYYDGSENVIVSSLYEVFKTSEDIDDRYLWHWFKSNNFKKLIEQYQEGGVRLYFYYDKLCMCSLPTPSIQEQVKIGRYFDNLDNLITLHQRELEKLQNIKKSMLEKMFV